MPKPDPALLDPAPYPFHCSIETRFADLDLNQHLNNAALVGLLEEGRVRYHRAAGNHGPGGQLSPMIVSIAVEFLGQSYFPDPLDIHVAAGPPGRTSSTLYHLAAQQRPLRRLCASGDGEHGRRPTDRTARCVSRKPRALGVEAVNDSPEVVAQAERALDILGGFATQRHILICADPEKAKC